MTISDETLMAYADDELDASQREAVELAMRRDPEIEQRIAQHRALRERLQRAYSPELSEPVTERLLATLREAGPPAGNVVDLRAARDAMSKDLARRRPPKSWWLPVGSIAASLVVGAGLGYFMWRGAESPFAQSAGGALVARGRLAEALSTRLAADQAGSSTVRIGLSFRAKSGDYCRTFSLSGSVSPAGLACRHEQEWQIQTLTGESGDVGTTEFRTAGSPMPAAVLSAVEQIIAGEPLDQAGESAARGRGWSAAAR